MKQWYLVHSKPAGETVAHANLSRQGYEVYLPRVAQAVRRGGQLRERITALFPRYLFLRLSEGVQSLGPVRSSVGVSGIVRFGFDYAVVPERIVAGLMAREDPVTGLHQTGRHRALVPGQTVEISSGPLDGLQGIFEREAGDERVIILLRLLGHEVSVRVPRQFVYPGRAA